MRGIHVAKTPRGIREDGNQNLYTKPTNDPRIVPDRTSPAVEAYFRVPAIWMG